MIENYQLPWQDGVEGRVASTVDIESTLLRADPGSLDEFALCYEVALDSHRDVSARGRFLLATYGRDFAESPDQINGMYDDLEKRVRDGVGDWVLIKNGAGLMHLARISSPEVNYITHIGRAANVPMGIVAIDIGSRQLATLDEENELVPELSSDFVLWESIRFGVEERGTDAVWDDKTNEFIRCEHNGEQAKVLIGSHEIQQWLSDNPEWVEHYDNMLGAFKTGGINRPVAAQQPFA